MERNITLGFAVALLPQAIPYFEQLGLDFCCGGQRLIKDAIKEKGLSEDAVFEYLDNLQMQLLAKGEGKNYLEMPSNELADYIVATHHAYLRQVMPTITEYMNAVMRAHGATHPEIFQVAKLFGALKADLEQHLLKEEMFLFPSMKNDDFSTAKTAEYIHEHEDAGEVLAKLQKLTNHYTIPDDACETFAVLYTKMHEMEEDLHRHIHLENNILFLRGTQQ